MNRGSLSFILLILATGCATGSTVNYERSRAALERQLAGRTPGEAADCIPIDSSTGPAIYANDTILYRDGPVVWRTGPVGTCPGLRPNVTLIVEAWGTRLCANDRFRTIEPGTTIPGAVCRFNRFVPYRRADRG